MTAPSNETPFDENFIDLGDWGNVEPRSVTEKRARPVDETRAYLAYLLVGLLIVVVVGLILLLWFKRVPAESFAEIAGLLISPLVGLVGAVTGYYYGKSDRT